MSVDITIKQTGLFKKKLDLEKIIKDCGLSYGICDENYRLCENEIGEHTLVFKRENGLARGIDISLDKNDIHLLLSLPTSKNEIILFYEFTKQLCRMLKTNRFERNGESCKFDKIEQFIEDDIHGSECGLEMIKKNLEENKYNRMEIFGIYNPISLGLKEMQEIGNDINKFGKYLNDLQARDVFYAAPRVYNFGGKLVGIYAVMPDNPSVMPDKPYIVLNQLEGIEDWYVFFGEGLTVKYEDFINYVDKSDYYDQNHFVVKLNSQQINLLAEKFSVKL